MWWRRRQNERDLDRELKTHLDLEAEEQRDAGLPSTEASYAARRALGNRTLIKEDTRVAWGWARFERFFQDLRQGFRLLARNPAFATVVVLTLAIGIGANTAIFGVIDNILLRPLPYPHPERLVRIWEAQPSRGYFRNVVNGVNFLDWRARNHSFEHIAAFWGMPKTVTRGGRSQDLPAMQVTPEFFSILGVSPYLGRTFLPEEGAPGRNRVIVLSYALWQSYFGGDHNVLGKTLTVDGVPATIVGVMPRNFSFPNYKWQLWTPLAIVRSNDWAEGRSLVVIGRLRPGVSIDQAASDMANIAQQLAQERPNFDKDWTTQVFPLLDDLTERVRLPLLVLLAGVAFVLLVACANLANLLLMRGTARLPELAVRAALGAGKGRIVQQLLTETLVLALAGWLVGIAVAYASLRGLLKMIPADNPLPRIDSVHLDVRVFLFSLAVTLITVLLFGLIPAFRVAGSDIQQRLRGGSLRTGVGVHKRLRQGLVIAEIALSLLLLAGAGLMLRSFHKLVTTNPGFAPEHVLTMSLSMVGPAFQDDAKQSRYLEQILTAVRSVPGVDSAGSVHFLPMRGQTSGSCFAPFGQSAEASSAPDAEFLIVSSGYFRAMGMGLLAGRDFRETDRFGSPSVLIVNQAFVNQFLRREDPIGQKLNVCWTISNPVRIIGVVSNARQTELETGAKPTIFLDNAQTPMPFASIAIRTRTDPYAVFPSAAAAIHQVNAEQAISQVETMEDVLSDSVARPRFQLVLLAIFALIALLLAALGVYGVVSYSVLQRIQEIGIRVALGARGSDVARMVFVEGLVLAGIGAAIGLVAALLLTRLMKTLLFEVQPGDPATFLWITAALFAVTALAVVIPVRRAVRVDPVVALRYQ